MALHEEAHPEARPTVTRAPDGGGVFVEGARVVDVSHGTRWIADGWRTFRADAGTWVLIALILIVFVMVLSAVPLLGHIAVTVLMPVFIGGLMIGCNKRETGERVGVSDLFAGFQGAVGPLLILGAIAFGLTVLAAVPAGLLAVALGLGAPADSPRAVLVPVLAFLALFVPVQMALWFAPALVVLRKVAPGSSLAQSFRACLKNVMPFLLYGVILAVLAIAATLPLLLGWLVLMPVLIGSIYWAYRDIFFEA